MYSGVQECSHGNHVNILKRKRNHKYPKEENLFREKENGEKKKVNMRKRKKVFLEADRVGALFMCDSNDQDNDGIVVTISRFGLDFSHFV